MSELIQSSLAESGVLHLTLNSPNAGMRCPKT